jgi:hypothetical protein
MVEKARNDKIKVKKMEIIKSIMSFEIFSSNTRRLMLKLIDDYLLIKIP